MSKFTFQITPVSSEEWGSSWALALKSSAPDVLDDREDSLLSVGFIKNSKGIFVLPVNELSPGVLDIPDDVKKLLSESPLGAIAAPTPWIAAPDLNISLTARIQQGKDHPTTVIASGAPEVLDALILSGFKRTPNGKVYLAHKDNRGFINHSELYLGALIALREAAESLGFEPRKVTPRIAENAEVVGSAAQTLDNGIFEMPVFSKIEEPNEVSEIIESSWDTLFKKTESSIPQAGGFTLRVRGVSKDPILLRGSDGVVSSVDILASGTEGYDIAQSFEVDPEGVAFKSTIYVKALSTPLVFQGDIANSQWAEVESAFELSQEINIESVVNIESSLAFDDIDLNKNNRTITAVDSSFNEVVEPLTRDVSDKLNNPVNTFGEPLLSRTPGVVESLETGEFLDKDSIPEDQWHLRFDKPNKTIGGMMGVESIIASIIHQVDTLDLTSLDSARMDVKKILKNDYGVDGVGVTGSFVKSIETTIAILTDSGGLESINLLKNVLEKNPESLSPEELADSFKKTIFSLNEMIADKKNANEANKRKQLEVKIDAEDSYVNAVQLLESLQEYASGDAEKNQQGGLPNNNLDLLVAAIDGTFLIDAKYEKYSDAIAYLERQERVGKYPLSSDLSERLKSEIQKNIDSVQTNDSEVLNESAPAAALDVISEKEQENGSMVSPSETSLAGIPTTESTGTEIEVETSGVAGGQSFQSGGSESSSEDNQRAGLNEGNDGAIRPRADGGVGAETLILAAGIDSGRGNISGNDDVDLVSGGVPSILSLKSENSSDQGRDQEEFFSRLYAVDDSSLINLGMVWVSGSRLNAFIDEESNTAFIKDEEGNLYLGMNSSMEAVFLSDPVFLVDEKRFKVSEAGLVSREKGSGNAPLGDEFSVVFPASYSQIQKTNIEDLKPVVQRPAIISKTQTKEVYKELAREFTKNSVDIDVLSAAISKGFEKDGESPLFVAIQSPTDNSISKYHIFSKVKYPLVATPETHNQQNTQGIENEIINTAVVLRSADIKYLPVSDERIAKVYPEYIRGEVPLVKDDVRASNRLLGSDGVEVEVPERFFSQMDAVAVALGGASRKVFVSDSIDVINSLPTTSYEFEFGDEDELLSISSFIEKLGEERRQNLSISFRDGDESILTAAKITSFLNSFSEKLALGGSNVSIDGITYYEFYGFEVGQEYTKPEVPAAIERENLLVDWSLEGGSVSKLVGALEGAAIDDEIRLANGSSAKINGIPGVLSISLDKGKGPESVSYKEIFGAELSRRLVDYTGWPVEDWEAAGRDQPDINTLIEYHPELSTLALEYPRIGEEIPSIINISGYESGSYYSSNGVKYLIESSEILNNFKGEFNSGVDVARELLTSIATDNISKYTALESRVVGLATALIKVYPEAFVENYPDSPNLELDSSLVKNVMYSEFQKYTDDSSKVVPYLVRYDEGKYSYLRGGEVVDTVTGNSIAMNESQFLNSPENDKVKLNHIALSEVLPLANSLKSVCDIKDVAILNPNRPKDQIKAEAVEQDNSNDGYLSGSEETEALPIKEISEKSFPPVSEAIILNEEESDLEVEDTSVSGDVARFEANMQAVELLKVIEAKGKSTTTDKAERITLNRYSGWGSLSKAFKQPNGTYAKGWEERASRLEGLLTDNEYRSARESTLHGFYTKQGIVKEIYSGLDRLGVKEAARIIEPALGSGNFINDMPPRLKNSSEITGIELDDLTGRIAGAAHGASNITVHSGKGFEDYNPSKKEFDVVISNAPFGRERVFDPARPHLSSSIHNYFSMRAMDILRPGGIKAFITSSHLMDARSTKIREKLAEQGELVGAIRLPNDAFKSNAGTSVVSDIIFMKKYNEGDGLGLDEKGANVYPNWVYSDLIDLSEETTYGNRNENKREFFINRYFIDNPGMVIGEMAVETGAFREQVTVNPPLNFEKDLAVAISTLPMNIYSQEESVLKQQQEMVVGEVLRSIPEGKNTKYISVGGMFTHNGKTFLRNPDSDFSFNATEVLTRIGTNGKPVKLTSLDKQRVYGQIEIKELVDELLHLESDNNTSDETLDKIRVELGSKYDVFVKKHGFLNRTTNSRLVRQDPSYIRLVALEKDYQPEVKANKSKQIEAKSEKCSKADIFSKRVAGLGVQVDETAATAEDALALSLTNKGRIDLSYMESLLPNSDRDSILKSLKKDIFINPITNDYEWGPVYLSGNVKKKLAEAEAALDKDDRFKPNVESLLEVIPADIPLSDIGIIFGAHWITAELYENYINESAGDTNGVKGFYNKLTGSWGFEVNKYLVERAFSTDKVKASRILEAAANNNPIKVTETGPDGEKIELKAATAEANLKVSKVKSDFAIWTSKSPEVSEEIHSLFNSTMNTNVRSNIEAPKNYYPQNTIPKELFEFRKHQLDYAFRSLLQNNIAAVHFAGAGKTAAEIISTMEQVRVGQVSKALASVPNHLIRQWALSISQIYPDAKIMIAGKDDFKKENREKFFARVATNQVDITIIGHSQLPLLPTDYDLLLEYEKEEVENITLAISDAKENNASNTTVKQMEGRLKSAKARIKDAVFQQSHQTGISFKLLGFDKIIADESHYYKNLPFQTKLTAAGIGNPTGAKKCVNFLTKVKHMQRNNGKVALLSATPISNSISEMYAFLRYTAPDALEEKGIYSFDGFIKAFAEVETKLELKLTGDGYKMTSRLATFKNIPELLDMYLEVADCVSEEDVKASVINTGGKWFVPSVRGGRPELKTLKQSSEQEEIFELLSDRMDVLDSGSNVDPKVDNKLLCLTHGRLASLHPKAFDGDSEELMVGKLEEAFVGTKQEIERMQLENNHNGLHIIFCDLGVPKSAKGRERERVNLLLENVDSFDEAVSTAAQQELDAYGASELESILSDNDFCFQDSLREVFLTNLLKDEQVASLHDANTAEEKQAIFDRCRRGEITVLFATTSKGGEGMDVANYAAGVLHVDAPLVPSHFEQRNRRVQRQGNKFFNANPEFEVYIKCLTTERSSDAWTYQTLEFKARSLNQIIYGSCIEREISDVGEVENDFAKIKALTTGNDLILQQYSAQKEAADTLTEMRLQKGEINEYNRSISNYEKSITSLTKANKEILELKQAYEAGKPESENVEVIVKGKSTMRKAMNVEIEKTGVTYTDSMSGGAEILNILRMQAEKSRGDDEIFVGRVNGVEMYASKSLMTRKGELEITFKAGGYSSTHTLYDFSVSPKTYGKRIDNLICSCIARLDTNKVVIKRSQVGLEKLRAITPPTFDETLNERLEVAEALVVELIAKVDAENHKPATISDVEDVLSKIETKYDEISTLNEDISKMVALYKAELVEIKEAIENGNPPELQEFKATKAGILQSLSNKKSELGLSKRSIFLSNIKEEARKEREELLISKEEVADLVNTCLDGFSWLKGSEAGLVVYETMENLLEEGLAMEDVDVVDITHVKEKISLVASQVEKTISKLPDLEGTSPIDEAEAISDIMNPSLDLEPVEMAVNKDVSPSPG